MDPDPEAIRSNGPEVEDVPLPDTRTPVRAQARAVVRVAIAVGLSGVAHVVALLALPGATHVHELAPDKPLRVALAPPPVEPPKVLPLAPEPPKPAAPPPPKKAAPPPPPAPTRVTPPAPPPVASAPVPPTPAPPAAAPEAPREAPPAPSATPPRMAEPTARPAPPQPAPAPPAVAPTPPAPAAAPAPYTPPVAQAGHLSNPRPDYPRAAQRRGEEGTVLLRVLVSPEGRPTKVTLERSSGFPALDRAALDKVTEAWRFVPARRGDQTVEGEVLVPITFQLAGG